MPWWLAVPTVAVFIVVGAIAVAFRLMEMDGHEPGFRRTEAGKARFRWHVQRTVLKFVGLLAIIYLVVWLF